MATSRISEAEIEIVFHVFDTDCTGRISIDEMTHALQSLGWGRVSEDDVRAMYTQVELSDPEEGATMSEFSEMVSKKQRLQDGPEECHAAFRLFDVDGKGRISADNLRKIGEMATGRQPSDKMIVDIMKIADLDNDGFLVFDEFRRAVTKHEQAAANAPAASATAGSGAAFAADEVSTAEAHDDGAADEGFSGRRESGDASTAGKTEVIAGVKVTFVNGLITKTEVRRALNDLGYEQSTLSDEVYNDLFLEQDRDKDGLLTMDEYCTFLVSFGEQVDGY